MDKWLLLSSGKKRSAEPQNQTSHKKINFDSKSYEATKRDRKFQLSWLKDFSWLLYDKERNLMFCRSCKAHSEENDFVSGTNLFRRTILLRHESKKEHQDAVSADMMKTQKEMGEYDGTKTSIGRGILALHSQQRDRLRCFFNTAYGLAKHARPYTDFSIMCAIQSKNNLDLGENYTTDKKAAEFTSYIAKSIKDDITKKVNESRFYTVLADGSTDASIVEQEVIYVRYVEQGKPVTRLAGIVGLNTGNSDGVLEGIHSGLSSLKLEASSQNPTMIGCNFDGAAVMMGHKTGVAKKLQDDLPWLISIQCVAHKLELGVLDAIKSIDYLPSFETTVKRIYNFYHYSPKRRRELQEISSVLEQDLLQYGAVKSVRWVASKSRALTAIKKNLGATITHLEHAAANNRNADETGKAKEIKKTVSSYKFVKFLHLMLDVLELVRKTSRLFQRKDLLLVEVPAIIEDLQLNLQAMKTVPGNNMTVFYKAQNDNGTFGETGVHLSGKKPVPYGEDKDVKSVTEGVETYVQKRFNTFLEPPLSHFSIFNYKQWPFNLPPEELATFGNTDISNLLLHFSQILEEEEADEIMTEWAALKNQAMRLRDSPMMDVYAGLLHDPPARLEHIVTLLQLMFVLSPSTAECERGFSAMNRIKTAIRNSLSQKALNEQMTIIVDGPSLEEFTPDRVIDLWLTNTPGHHHLSGHKLPTAD